VQGLRLAAESCTYHFDTDKSAAASLVFRAISKYGRIAGMSHEKETAAIDALTRELKEMPALNDAMTLLGLHDWRSELEDANQSFHALYLSRVDERASDKVPAATILRSTVNATYYELLDLTESLARVSDREEYMPLIDRLNVLNDRYSDAADTGSRNDAGDNR